jgi:hypothetical protein
MNMTQVLQSRQKRLNDVETAYKLNVVTVHTLFHGVTLSSLPALRKVPSGWDKFTATFDEAKNDAGGWESKILHRLENIPKDIMSYKKDIADGLTASFNAAGILEQNPSNKIARKLLQDDLQIVSDSLGLISGSISSLLTEMDKFSTNFPEFAKDLQDIATESAADVKADQTKIDQLNAAITALNDEITDLAIQIAIAGLADLAAITVGAISLFAGWPLGAIGWGIIGLVVAGTTAIIALDSIKIVEDKKKIEADQSQLTDFTADVAVLSVFATQYKQFADAVDAMKKAYTAIRIEWLALENDMNGAVKDITDAMANEGSGGKAADYAAIKTDLTSAAKLWDDTCTIADTLIIKIEINDAKLTIGMSEEEVKKALSGGNVITLIDYCRNLAKAA